MNLSSRILTCAFATATFFNIAVLLPGIAPLHAADAPASTAPATAPKYPANFVGNPEFSTTKGRNAAGTASVIKGPDGTSSYIISVRHLLGPDGGFKDQTPAADVPDFVKSIALMPLGGGSKHSYTVKGLSVPTTALETNKLPMDDLAIYKIQETFPPDYAVALADKLPAVGDPLWVIGSVRGGVPAGQVVHPGVVTVASPDGWLKMQFDNDAIVTNGASGAPVLNAAGQVVGIYSGHAKDKKHKIAFIVPVTLIRSVLEKAK